MDNYGTHRHEHLKRQLEQQGIPYQALDNGILSCPDPGQRIVGGKRLHVVRLMLTSSFNSCHPRVLVI
jgi:hypothetical protein